MPIWKIIYRCIGYYLPGSDGRCKLWKKFRAFCGKQIMGKCGEDVNIEKHSIWSEKVTLGDRSGIGINCRLGGEVHIGNDVMMGPDCRFITINHEFCKTDIPMMNQGFMKERPIVVGNDVWIGMNVIVVGGGTYWRWSDNRSRSCGYEGCAGLCGCWRKSCDSNKVQKMSVRISWILYGDVRRQYEAFGFNFNSGI